MTPKATIQKPHTSIKPIQNEQRIMNPMLNSIVLKFDLPIEPIFEPAHPIQFRGSGYPTSN